MSGNEYMHGGIDICCSILVMNISEHSDRWADCPTDTGLTDAEGDIRNTSIMEMDSDQALEEEDDQQSEQVRDEFIEVGKLAEERVFLLETDLAASGNQQIRSRLTITAGS